MKKSLRGIVALALLAAIGLGLYAARLVRSLGTPEFKARVAQEASAVVGARVRLASLDVSLLRGVRLTDISVQNPPGFAGDLLAVEGARLSYDLWPLLLGRVQLDELSLRKPVITLEADARGNFNYQKLSALAPRAPGPSSSAAASTDRPHRPLRQGGGHRGGEGGSAGPPFREEEAAGGLSRAPLRITPAVRPVGPRSPRPPVRGRLLDRSCRSRCPSNRAACRRSQRRSKARRPPRRSGRRPACAS